MNLRVEWSRKAHEDFLAMPWPMAAKLASQILRFAETGEGEVLQVPGAKEAPYRIYAPPYAARISVDRVEMSLLVWRIFKF
jgi:hypothetical protein